MKYLTYLDEEESRPAQMRAINFLFDIKEASKNTIVVFSGTQEGFVKIISDKIRVSYQWFFKNLSDYGLVVTIEYPGLANQGRSIHYVSGIHPLALKAYVKNKLNVVKKLVGATTKDIIVMDLEGRVVEDFVIMPPKFMFDREEEEEIAKQSIDHPLNILHKGSNSRELNREDALLSLIQSNSVLKSLNPFYSFGG